MNATVTLVGGLMALVGVLATATVAYLGKRGENALTGYTSLTDQLQEELATKKQELVDKNTLLTAKDAALAEKSEQRAADQAEITRLRGLVWQLGGDPT
ncbi:hypothetical protein [Streptomyces liliifuscus]|uniref:Uncharacterized protein n=1 Tax=Streptomyces liliifuscus TaxID=2797636 RepID=A0A7T7RFZ5_9ACTN|nr:hypothetical protein [Streptomyces liliifuscus]QQM45225.1 hypothetical protein JEQ17_41340 [Streptomyces liliifuscus]